MGRQEEILRALLLGVSAWLGGIGSTSDASDLLSRHVRGEIRDVGIATPPSTPAPDDTLVLTWPVPRFTQTVVPQSVPGRGDPLTVRWVGNEVVGIEPRGNHLPMFGP
jgi:hypothetical protein